MHPRLYRAACSALLGLQVGEVIDHYPEIAEDEPYEKYERLRKTKEVYRRVSRLASRELFSTAETWRLTTPWQGTRSSKSLFSTSSSYWVVVIPKILRGVICGAAVMMNNHCGIADFRVCVCPFLFTVFQNQSNPVLLDIDNKTTFGILLFRNKYMYRLLIIPLHPREWST